MNRGYGRKRATPGADLHPIIRIGGVLLTIAVAIACHFDTGTPYAAALPIDLAAALVLGGLLTTTRAAPKMLSLRRIGDDPAALQQALDGFRF
jgi:hypothetical protein